MGFFRKITGVDKQVRAAQENAAATVEATKQATAAQQQALMAAAQEAARNQTQIAARSAAEAKASEAVSQPLDTADVQLDEDGANSSRVRRAKRASFGRNYSGGASI